MNRSGTVRDAIGRLDAVGMQIVLIVDETGRLEGTVTDGDIRRGLLRGIELSAPVERVMNPDPITIKLNEPRQLVLALMQKLRIHQMPVVDDAGIVQGLETLDELLASDKQPNWVVLMAGGLGARLRPLTEDCPKPMLRVGNKPLLETIIQSFVEQGFNRFFISVNYMAETIMSYFGDGAALGARIDYLVENDKLGTAGALGLLPERPEAPLLVMNGDILTRVNFQQMLAFHKATGADATMCIREYEHTVPYGVVRVDDHRIVEMSEKPTHRFFVNAGIYTLEPRALEKVGAARYLDMPTFFSQLKAAGRTISAYPIREYWLDIGQMADFDRAQGEFASVFGGG